MLTVHHLETSRSQRILWLLEELAVPYTIRLYRRDPVSRLAPAALKQIHQLGKSPVVTDGDTVVANRAPSSNTWWNALAPRHGTNWPSWSRRVGHPNIASAASGCTTRKVR